MPVESNGATYSLAIRILHWLMAVMIIGLLCVGLYMTGLSRDDPMRATLYGLHKSVGVTVLALAAIRLFIRLKEGTPPFPAVISRFEALAAKSGHWALYGFMALLPVSGYVMTNSLGRSVQWFGVELPRIAGVDVARGTFLNGLHSYAGFALIGVIALHVSAVIWHYVRQRVNLLPRIW